MKATINYWRYGCHLRPYIGPYGVKGVTGGPGFDRHGWIGLERELTREEIEHFDLRPIVEGSMPHSAAALDYLDSLQPWYGHWQCLTRMSDAERDDAMAMYDSIGGEYADAARIYRQRQSKPEMAVASVNVICVRDWSTRELTRGPLSVPIMIQAQAILADGRPVSSVGFDGYSDAPEEALRTVANLAIADALHRAKTVWGAEPRSDTTVTACGTAAGCLPDGIGLSM